MRVSSRSVSRTVLTVPRRRAWVERWLVVWRGGAGANHPTTPQRQRRRAEGTTRAPRVWYCGRAGVRSGGTTLRTGCGTTALAWELPSQPRHLPFRMVCATTLTPFFCALCVCVSVCPSDRVVQPHVLRCVRLGRCGVVRIDAWTDDPFGFGQVQCADQPHRLPRCHCWHQDHLLR